MYIAWGARGRRFESFRSDQQNQGATAHKAVAPSVLSARVQFCTHNSHTIHTHFKHKPNTLLAVGRNLPLCSIAVTVFPAAVAKEPPIGNRLPSRAERVGVCPCEGEKNFLFFSNTLVCSSLSPTCPPIHLGG